MRDFVCQAMVDVEEGDWWHRNLRETVKGYLKKFSPGGGKILDVGCGGGYFLAQLPNVWQKWGVDADLKMVKRAKTRGLVNVCIGRMETLPFADNLFDVVTALDVLEHLSDDEKGIEEAWRVAKHEGILILNVPAYRWLWSYHDESALHVRRYTRREVVGLLEKCGWGVERATYTGLWLLPLVVIYRWVGKLVGMKKKTDVGTGRRWGKILYTICRLERGLLKFVSLPAGTSVSVVARKLDG